MMVGTKIKIAVATVLAMATVAGNVAVATTALLSDETGEENTKSIYTVEKDGSTLSVDTKTLNLSIERGGRTWYSGKRYSEEDGLNTTWVNKLTDAVTIGYRIMSTGNPREQSISMLNASVTFKEREDGFNAKIRCRRIDVTFTLEVRIKGNTLQVRVPYDSIEEGDTENYKLEYLTVYPFFDSSYSLVDGEILLPDGSGAVIDLSTPTSAKQSYSARVYGDDYGISARKMTVNSPEIASMPVFALMYNDGGTMFTADSGSEYCTINASVSSITTNYNFAYFNWIYREPYVKYYESTGTAGNSYEAFQEEKNEFDLVQTMTLFEDDCTISDVANAYREKVEFKNTAAETSAGLRLQFLMAENKNGMFGKEVLTMTRTKYAESVAEKVSEYCNNLKISVLGYTKGGLNNSYPDHFPLDSGPGGNKGYKNLSAKLSELGAELSFVTDYAKAYSGASISEKKLSLNISNQFIVLDDSRAGSDAKFNLVNPQDAADMLSDELKDIKKYNAGVDYSSVCSLLYSGYKNKDFDRADTARIYKEAVASTGIKANMIKPNSYMWSVCDSYLDIPISSSGFMIETESVPFLQMVVSGKMQTYCTAINLNYTGEELVLRLIDYNVYPSFLLTEKDSLELYGTNSSGIFTSSYSIWKDMVKSIYNDINGVLSQVAGCSMTNRFKTENGLYVTEYSNGKCVVVNYGSTEAEYGGQTIAAKSAVAANKV